MKVVIPASGPAYQEAAAWAAATFAGRAGKEHKVVVLVPASESLGELLSAYGRKFGFRIGRFPFRQISENKYTSQLKCQAYVAAVSELKGADMVLFVDADTCCLRRISFARAVVRAIRLGSIGLVPDIADRHSQSPADPWYLPPERRLPYVNSGVILASAKSLPLFRQFRTLSEQPEFLCGPFNDQKVINYALGKSFGDRLMLLERKYNWIGPPFSSTGFIAHHAGGAGWLGQQRRKATHAAHCAEILKKRGLLPALLNSTSSSPVVPTSAAASRRSFPTVCAKHTKERPTIHTDRLPQIFQKKMKNLCSAALSILSL